MSETLLDMNQLLALLQENPDKALVFQFGESIINPEYHVTEIKHARINSVDCGKKSKPEHWEELCVQLLDGAANNTGAYMPTGKFAGIVGTAVKRLNVESNAALYFEFSPNNGPMNKLHAVSIDADESQLRIHLGSQSAVCKPFQRSKLAQATVALSGGAIGLQQLAGCCSGKKKQSRCCE